MSDDYCDVCGGPATYWRRLGVDDHMNRCARHIPSAENILTDLIAGLRRHPDVAVQVAIYKLLDRAEDQLRYLTPEPSTTTVNGESEMPVNPRNPEVQKAIEEAAPPQITKLLLSETSSHESHVIYRESVIERDTEMNESTVRFHALKFAVDTAGYEDRSVEKLLSTAVVFAAYLANGTVPHE